MKSLEERQKERAARLHMVKAETANSDAARGELQAAAEAQVATDDKAAGVKSAPLSTATATVKKDAVKSPFDTPKTTAKKKK